LNTWQFLGGFGGSNCSRNVLKTRTFAITRNATFKLMPSKTKILHSDFKTNKEKTFKLMPSSQSFQTECMKARHKNFECLYQSHTFVTENMKASKPRKHCEGKT